MIIAVTYENGEIFQHFGHTEQFKIYEVKGGEITADYIIGANGSGHGALAGMLASINTNVLICGGIGGGAKNALKQAGIELFGGVSGNADEAVKKYLEGKLEYNSDAHCEHHDKEHCEHHTCGEHGCK